MKGWGHNKVNAAKEAGIKMQTEEAQAEAAQEFYTVFGDSDKDCDGVLNCEEWIAFSKKYSELKAQRNEPETYQDDNTREKWYKVMNQATPDVEGVSMMDIGIVLSVGMHHLQTVLTEGH